jgi:hypothetical protein
MSKMQFKEANLDIDKQKDAYKLDTCYCLNCLQPWCRITLTMTLTIDLVPYMLLQ